MKTTLTTIALLGLLLFPAHAQPPESHAASLMQVIVTYQEYDSFQPWQKRNPGLKAGYGVAISPTEIITTENLVRNSTLVELRKAGSGEKIQATVVLADEQANLALLKVTDSDKREGFIPLDLNGANSRTGDVSILQFDETAQIQRGKAQVVQVSIKMLPTAPYPSLAFTILTDLNINGEGAPALLDGRLEGLVMSYDRSSRTGTMLPIVTLKHFLNDVRQPHYKGFASGGFFWTPLVDPAKRKYLKVNQSNRGIMVLECMPGSSTTQTLAQNDVILEWDKYDIDNLGFYDDPDFGRLAFAYLIMGRRSPGDAVPVKIIRNGAETNINVTLTRRTDDQALVPDNYLHEREQYLVEGGFIIRELTGAYLLGYGAEWQKTVDPMIINIYQTRRFHPEKPGDRVVILSTVIPDQINIGYQQFRDEVITRVNGKPVRNMADVFAIVDKDRYVKRLAIKSVDVDLVLDESMLSEANARLAELYRIPDMRYARPNAK